MGETESSAHDVQPTNFAELGVRVHLLPTLVHPHELAGRWVLVVDVLRATTTLAAAVVAGVKFVIPCMEIVEARQLAAQRRAAGEDVLLCGERGGRAIPGFDLGNSPSEYTAERVQGRAAVMTTTNGTRAMMRCVGADRILLGSFVNLSTVLALIKQARPPILEVLCAGTDGRVSWEDTLFAGAIVSELSRAGFAADYDGSRIAEMAWRQVGGSTIGTRALAEAFRCGQGGRNLLAIDHGRDLEWAAEVDRLAVVPELKLGDWAIRAATVS